MKKDQSITIDKETLLLAQADNEVALKQVVDSCEGMVRSLAMKQAEKNSNISYEDLVQEGLICLCKAVKSFNVDNGSAKFSTYAYKCINNGLKTVMRKHIARQINCGDIIDLESLAGVLSDNKSMEDEVLSKLSVQEIMQTIKSSLKEKDVLIITYISERQSYSEIADKLNMSVKQVDVAVQRIRKKLKKIFH